jgi:hypothetical protein
VILGAGPLDVEFNLCQSRPAEESDDLRYTYDWNADGTVDWFGHCRKTERFTSATAVEVCVSDRRPDNTVCRRYDVRPGPPEPRAALQLKPCGGPEGQCVAFVTSTFQNGNLGGLAGADAVCQARADAAQLRGRYRAWLSDATASPSTRFARTAGDYVLVNGNLIARGWGDLTDGTLVTSIFVDERGVSATAFHPVWTNTRANGTAGGYLATGSDCQGWTSTTSPDAANVGRLYQDGVGEWTEGAFTYCSAAIPLYCFEQE